MMTLNGIHICVLNFKLKRVFLKKRNLKMSSNINSCNNILEKKYK